MKTFLSRVLAVCVSAATSCTFAQPYPAKPVRIVVGYPPAGATDLVARALGAKLQELLKQPVVVENRPGANSNIANELVAKSAPDGYVLLLGTIAIATNMSAYRDLGYDTLRDFAPVTQVVTSPSVLVVHPGFPARDLKELIALARANPGKYAFASTGSGSSPHLAGELLKQRAQIDLVHVPYKGAGPALNDLVAGHVPMGFQTALSAMPYMQAGRLRVIAVAAHKRLAQLPEAPTMAEAGLPDFEVSSWNGLFAPAKTSPEIIAILHRAVVSALAIPEVSEKLLAQGAEPVGSTPEAFREYVRSEIEKWGHVIRASGARFD
jgi:tripartite-type tricarboxylate transporter receptor subunit TctC